MMSAPRAPPLTTSVPGPTPQLRNTSRMACVTRASAEAGNRGVGRSGWSIMCPLTATACCRNGMVPRSGTGGPLDGDRQVAVGAEHRLDAGALLLGCVGPAPGGLGEIVEVDGGQRRRARTAEQLDGLDVGMVEVVAVRRHDEPVAAQQVEQLARDVAGA